MASQPQDDKPPSCKHSFSTHTVALQMDAAVNARVEELFAKAHAANALGAGSPPAATPMACAAATGASAAPPTVLAVATGASSSSSPPVAEPALALRLADAMTMTTPSHAAGASSATAGRYRPPAASPQHGTRDSDSDSEDGDDDDIMGGAADFARRWRADTAVSLSTYSSTCDTLDTSRDDSCGSGDSRASSAVTTGEAAVMSEVSACPAALMPTYAGAYMAARMCCGAVAPTARAGAAATLTH